MTISVGMDHGTGTCQVAVFDGKPQDVPNQNGDRATPSSFVFTHAGERLFGQEAENSALLEPDGYVTGYKRHLGDLGWCFTAPDGTQFSAKELTAIAVGHLVATVERFAGEKVTHGHFTVPANFNDAQRREMIDAITENGVTCLGLLNEPTAAAIAYSLDRNPGRPALMYDLGAGTFDATAIAHQAGDLHVLASDGIPQCGGCDLLAALEDRCVREFEDQFGFRPTRTDHPLFMQDLRITCERAKRSLSVRKETTITGSLDGRVLAVRITRDEYEALIAPIVAPTIQVCESVLDAASLSWGEADVVLVGGASRTPLVARLLNDASGKPPRADVDPDHAVARGAAIEAARALVEQGATPTAHGVAILPPAISLNDVAPHPLGCLSVDGLLGCKRCSVIVPKNAPLPAKESDIFSLLEPGQRSALVEVVQGQQDASPEQCHLIGELALDLDPHGPIERRVKVTYAYDKSGVVNVVAEDTHTGKTATIDLAVDRRKETV